VSSTEGQLFGLAQEEGISLVLPGAEVIFQLAWTNRYSHRTLQGVKCQSVPQP